MVINICDYGAVPDSGIVCTAAIQKAIDACSVSGGQVRIPGGRFVSGSLRLKSHIDLHLEQGAVLQTSLNPADIIDFSKDFEDDNPDTGWEGGCFLYAYDEEDITISGEGVIDGCGREYYTEEDTDDVHHECPLDVKPGRPRMSFLENVRGLTIRDVTFRDSAFWTIHMAGCRDVLIDSVRILNNERGPNNDGIDPDCCTNVIIRGCIITSGDDCIVIKTTAPMTAKYGECSHIIVDSCILRSRSSALKVGTETWGNIHHILMSNCILKDCTRGIGIWSRDGGEISDIMIHHLIGNTRRFADSTMRTEGVVTWWGKGDPVFVSATKREEVDRLPGRIRNLTFDQLDLVSESAILLAGEPYAPIEDVSFTGCRIHFRHQSPHPQDCLDERPSARGCYPADVPHACLRSCRNVSWDVRTDCDAYMAEHLIPEIRREDVT